MKALFLPLLLLALPLYAEELPSLMVPAGHVTVDGVLDDADWAKAPKVNLEAGEAQILWSPEGLYVAFRTEDPQLVLADTPPGGPLHEGDVFEMFIDAAGDALQYAEVQVNAAERAFFKNYVLTAPPRLTKTQRLTPEFCERELWRYDIPAPADFVTKSKVDGPAWTCELFLPAKFLNRRAGGGALAAGSKFHMNLARYDWKEAPSIKGRQGEFHYWVSVEPGCPHISPTRMGRVVLE